MLENLLICLKLENHLTRKAVIWTQCVCLSMLYANQVWRRQVDEFEPAKADEFELIYIVITDIDEKWFVIFELTINRLFFRLCLFPQLEYYFSCFRSLLFLLLLSTFKPLNVLYSKFERLIYQGGLLCDRNRGCQIGGLAHSDPPKFWIFK